MNKYTESFKAFFNPLSPAQRTMFVGLVLVIITVVGLMFYWALKPDYSLLFGSMQPDSAKEIVSQLEEDGVDYRLENSGRSIYVPSDKVDALRIELAPVGDTQSDMKGYELFDANALGMTDFMQQLNNKRALEGELARSINSLEQVELSRIHLVLPERSPFKKSSVKASASVIIKLKAGKGLSKKQIQGISALIAGSVEGLNASNVTILDQAGNRLTDDVENQPEFASGDFQMQLREKTESYLTERGQTMLDRVLGPGNSILRVSVEHDFDKLVRKSDLIDPESRIVMSEERSNEVHNTQENQPVQVDEFTPLNDRDKTMVVSKNDNETTTQSRKYETNKTQEVFEKNRGKIKRLTASVLINYKQETTTNAEGNQVTESKPYSQEEIRGFKEALQSALGIQAKRGDELTVKQVEFYEPITDGTGGSFIVRTTPWSDMVRWGLVLITFVAIVALLFSIRKSLRNGEMPIILGLHKGELDSIPLAENEPAQLDQMEQMKDEESEDFIDRKLSGKARKQLEQKNYVMEEIKEFVEYKPSEAAQVIRALMSSDED